MCHPVPAMVYYIIPKITEHFVASNFGPGNLVPIFLFPGTFVPCNFGPQAWTHFNSKVGL